jgi:hypothetical protein
MALSLLDDMVAVSSRTTSCPKRREGAVESQPTQPGKGREEEQGRRQRG